MCHDIGKQLFELKVDDESLLSFVAVLDADGTTTTATTDTTRGAAPTATTVTAPETTTKNQNIANRKCLESWARLKNFDRIFLNFEVRPYWRLEGNGAKLVLHDGKNCHEEIDRFSMR